jgi:hypothetical protein
MADRNGLIQEIERYFRFDYFRTTILKEYIIRMHHI